jgi:hypothetical protein
VQISFESGMTIRVPRAGDGENNGALVDSAVRPDLIWDDVVRGLCVRAYPDGSEAFIFVYRTQNRQRFTRIGKTPIWTRDAARKRALELRLIVDQGGDPATYNREPQKVRSVEDMIQYIADQQRTEP